MRKDRPSGPLHEACLKQPRINWSHHEELRRDTAEFIT